MKTHKQHRLTRVLVLALAIAAIAAPASHAYIPSDPPSSITTQATPSTNTEGAFDWTDAGIGAGFTIGLLLLAPD